MSTTNNRLPTSLWVEAQLRRLNAAAVPYYIVHKGDHAGGLVVLKLNGRESGVSVLIQQRGLDGVMGWAHALPEETVEEADADAYIQRALSRDPDLWVIEIEDPARENPFEGQII